MFHQQKCKNCGDSLSGRADKKFCTDQCRSAYNNRNKQAHEKAISMVNSQLRKNRTILKSLCPVGKATVRKEFLEEMGFSFRHFTSIFGKMGNTYFLCYDFGFMPLTERSLTDGKIIQKVLIIQYQPFMKNFDPWRYHCP